MLGVRHLVTALPPKAIDSMLVLRNLFSFSGGIACVKLK
jgi:hypothetical protein